LGKQKQNWTWFKVPLLPGSVQLALRDLRRWPDTNAVQELVLKCKKRNKFSESTIYLAADSQEYNHFVCLLLLCFICFCTFCYDFCLAQPWVSLISNAMNRHLPWKSPPLYFRVVAGMGFVQLFRCGGG